MKIFYSFLILVIAVFLWMLPITDAIYDFRSDVREDSFPDVETDTGETSANVTLLKILYDDNTNSFAILSDLSTDLPAYSSYNSTNRVLTVSGLTANTTRDLLVEYDINAFSGQAGFETFFDYLPYFYYIMVAIFPMASIAAIWVGRA